MVKLIDSIELGWPSIIVSLAIVVALVLGADGLALNTNYNAYFDPDDPLISAHRELSEQYAQFDGIVVILQGREGDMLTPKNLGLLERITMAADEIPFVRRVSSITNLAPANPDLEHNGNELSELFSSLDDQGAADERNLLDDVQVRGHLLSDDARFAAVEVAYSLPENGGPAQILESITALRKLVALEIAGADTAVDAYYSGTLALNEAYIRVVRHDLRLFVPALCVLMFGALLVLFRSIRLALCILATAGVSVADAFGTAGWLGFELASIHAFVPVIIASIAIASAVHIVTSYLHQRSAGNDTEGAIRTSLRENLLPLTLTSATTALGFLGLALSPSPPVRVVGYIVAIGIALSFFMTIALLPSLLWVFAKRANGSVNLPRMFRIERFTRVSAVNPGRIGVIFGIVGILGLGFVGGNEINDNVFEYFGTSNEFRRDTSLLDDHFNGVNGVSYAIESGHEYGIFAQEFLNAVQSFVAWLNEQPEVRRTLTITDFPQVRDRLDDPGLGRTLERYREFAQFHTPAGFGAEQYVNDDFSAVRIGIYLANLDSQALIDFDRRAQSWLSGYPAVHSYTGGSGPSLMFAYLGQRNAASMIISLGIALVVIGLASGLILRFAKVAWIGLICKLAPVVIVYAAWALFDGKIGLGAAIMLGMILGIIVDDTIYLLTNYVRRARIGRYTAIQDALEHVGPAIIITTLTLIMGLGVGMLSDFSPIYSMSALSVGVIACALMVDLFALPALLHLTDRTQYATRLRWETSR